MRVMLVAGMLLEAGRQMFKATKKEFNSSLFLGHIMSVSSIYLHILWYVSWR